MSVAGYSRRVAVEAGLVAFDPFATFDLGGHTRVPTIEFGYNRNHVGQSLWRATSRNGLKDLA